MSEENIKFLTAIAERYYSTTRIPLPKNAQEREYAVETFDSKFIRHIGLSSDKSKVYEEFKKKILYRIPKSVFYSAARYSDPKNKNMEEKGWICTELIFDLDADHIEGYENLSYEEALEYVKRETIKLVEILENDFGLEDKIQIVFSGRRGYHVHVYSDEFASLSADGRRELVNYLTLKNVNFESLYHRITAGKIQNRPWIRRYLNFVSDKIKNNRDDIVELIVRSGFRTNRFSREDVKYVMEVLEYFKEEKIEKIGSIVESLREAEDRRRERLLEGILHTFWDCFIKESTPHIDELVTTDLSRLIRLPYTIHGKTFMRALPVSRENLVTFDPLREAIIPSLENVEVEVEVLRDIKIRLGDETYSLSPGPQKINALVGAYLVANNSANIIKYNLLDIKSLKFR